MSRPGSSAIIPNLCFIDLYPPSRGSSGRCSNVTFSGSLKCHLLSAASLDPNPSTSHRFSFPPSIVFSFLSIHYPPGLRFCYSLSLNRRNKFLQRKHLGVLVVHYHISEPITVTIVFRMKEFTDVSFLGQAGHEVSPAKIFSGVLGISHATFPDFSRGPGQQRSKQISSHSSF